MAFNSNKERLSHLTVLLDLGKGDEARKLAYEWCATGVFKGRAGFEDVMKVFIDWHVDAALESTPREMG